MIGSLRSFWDSNSSKLGVRLALLLAITLLPLGVLTIQQTTEVRLQAQARSEAALMGETLRAAAPEVGAIQRAQGVARALAAAAPSFIADDAACDAAMDDVAAQEPGYSLVAYVPETLSMTCASGGREFLFPVTALTREIMAARDLLFSINRQAPVSGTSVLVITAPVYVAGAFTGVINISIPHAALQALTSASETEEFGMTMREPIVLVTFTETGTILTSSVGMDGVEDRLPADRTLASLAQDRPVAFTDRAANGTERSFSVVPLAAPQLFIIASWPVQQADALFGFNVPPVVYPALMWIASLIVALLAAEFLVTRHIRELGQSMLAFASGKRILKDLDLRSSPQEIREVGEAYLQMTETILHDEAEMEDMIHQKEVLLREVHHRVKNNLQLIASIMSMQMRQARTPEARELMKSLQERVMSLATIHRELYQTSGLTDIRAEELFRDLIRQIVNMASGPGHRFAVTTAFDDLLLTPDQAVPLALLLTEAMTNALKYAGGSPGHPASLDIRLLREEGRTAALTVTNSIGHGEVPPVAGGAGSGLGSQLVAAFANQLNGRLTTERTADSFTLRLVFEVRDLREAEAQNQPEADPAA